MEPFDNNQIPDKNLKIIEKAANDYVLLKETPDGGYILPMEGVMEIATDGDVTKCDCCCSRSQDITYASCEDIKDFTIQNVELKCQGRFLKIRVGLTNVCKFRDVNVGVLVCEEQGGTQFIKAFKACTVTIPDDDNPQTSCRSFRVDEFCFVFPGDICIPRTLKVKIIAHYASFPSFRFCPC